MGKEIKEQTMNYREASSALASGMGIATEYQHIRLDNFNVSYLAAGSGDPLVFVHGLNMGWGQWYPNIPYFASGYKVYAINLPGAGDSDPVRYEDLDGHKHLVQVLSDFLDYQKIKKAIVIGHSSGGWATVKLGLLRPDLISKMVLVSPLGFTTYTPIPQIPMAFKFIMKVLSKTVMRPTFKNMKNFFSGVMKNVNVVKKEFYDYYVGAMSLSEHNNPMFFINKIIGRFQVKKEFVFTDEELKNISWPVMIIGGTYDPIVKFKQEQYRKFGFIKNARVEVFAHSGHVAPIEEGQKFNNLVADFIKAD